MCSADSSRAGPPSFVRFNGDEGFRGWCPAAAHDCGDAGDLRRALELVQRARRDDPTADQLLAPPDRDLLQGMSTALSAIVPLIGPEPLLLLPTAMIRLSASGIHLDQLPTLAGLIVAAAQGRPPLCWRTHVVGVRAASICGSEWHGWIRLGVITVDLLDGLQGAGRCLALLEDVLRAFDL